MSAIRQVFGCVAAGGALLGALSATGARPSAQPTQPIYLQYDGFVRNKDGSFVLSFGYFNLNSADVTVSPGEANSFTPGPADRNQPVRFLKGRHRFACSMVVDKAFDGKLQWSVKFAGRTDITTAKPLDPLYELEMTSGKRAIAGLDLASAPKNLCLNRAPSVAIVSPVGELNNGSSPAGAPGVTTRVDQEAAINALVEDEGLPRGSTVTSAWKKVSGPGTVTFSDPATGPTRAKFSAPGAYVLDLSATDGEKSGSLKVNVTVTPAAEQAPESYVKTMKDIGAAQAALRTHTTAKDYDKIAADAAALKTLFDATGAFWQPRNAADAMGFVSAGARATDDLAAAAKGKNEEGVAASSRALGGACQGCHAAHRDRQPDGSYMVR